MARDVWLTAASKLLQRQCYTFLGSRVGLALLFIASVVTLNSVLQVIDGWFSSGIVCPHKCDFDWRDNLQRRSFEEFLGHEPIDLVYTWVNGSDPRLKATLERHKQVELSRHDHPNATVASPNASHATLNASATAHDKADASRFQDNQELRYSLRSVEHFAGWVRHVYIVTNGQVPAWLDLSNPRVTVVPHADLFPNQSHLPTFSSPAIEAHLHRIPGLSRRFLYLNDDTFFGNYIRPEDFYTPTHGHRIYLSWAVPDCNPGCTGTWIGDGYCDRACNVSACNFDGGDCLGKAAGSHAYNWDNYDYGSYNYHWTPFAQTSCNTGCMDNWIGDKFCDTACNVAACGFDATDCGIEDVHRRLHSLHLLPNVTNYSLDGQLTAFAVNLTLGLPTGMDVKTAMHHGGDNAIRATALSKAHHLLVIVLKQLNVRRAVTFRLEGEALGAPIHLNFTVVVGEDHPNTTNHTGNQIPRNADNVAASSGLPPQSSGSSLVSATAPRPSPDATAAQSPPNQLDSPVALGRSALLQTMTEVVGTSTVGLDGRPLQQQSHAPSPQTQSTAHPHNASPKPQPASPPPPPRWRAPDASPAPPPASPRFDLSPPFPNLTGARRLLQVVDAGARGPRGRQEEPLERSVPIPILDPAPPYRLCLPPSPTAVEPDAADDPFAMEPRWRGYMDPRDVQYGAGGTKALGSRLDYLAQPPHVAVRAGQRRLLDTFGDSLKFVNHLFTVKWGHHPRKVPAHMPHLIDRDVISELWQEWPLQWEATSATRFRSATDMQYAFSHFYYIVHAKVPVDPNKFFAEQLDINGNGFLEPREFRRLAILLWDKKVPQEALDQITVINGDIAAHNESAAAQNASSSPAEAPVPGAETPSPVDITVSSPSGARTLMYLDEEWGWGGGATPATEEEKTETGNGYNGWDDDAIYGNPKGPSGGSNRSGSSWDSNAAPHSSATSGQPEHTEPTMPKEYVDAVARVVSLATGDIGLLDATRFVASGMSKLVIGNKQVATHKYQLVELDEVSFFMIRNNASAVQHQMDHILAKQPKFICINDNMNHSHPENAKVVAVIHDFFEIYFPWRSSFELPAGKTNPHQYLDEMYAARKARRKAAGKFSALLVFLIGLAVFYSFVGLNVVLHWRPGHRRPAHDPCV